MNQLSLVKNDFLAKILYMNFDSDSYVLESVDSFNIKNLVIYGNKDIIVLDDIKTTKTEEIDRKDIIDSINKKEEDSNYIKQVEGTIEFKLSRLSQIVFTMLYQEVDETDEGDCFIVLDEIAKLKSIIEIKYQKYLKIEKYKEYLDALYYLDKEMRNKIAIINYKNSIREALGGRGR